jgi:hypothetical protein
MALPSWAAYACSPYAELFIIHTEPIFDSKREREREHCELSIAIIIYAHYDDQGSAPMRAIVGRHCGCDAPLGGLFIGNYQFGLHNMIIAYYLF